MDRMASLLTADFTAYTVLASLDSGDIMLALGTQYRLETLEQKLDDNYKNDRFAFLLGGDEFDADRDV